MFLVGWRIIMKNKKNILALIAVTSICTLNGCANLTPTQRSTLGGAALGTAVGAGVGAMSGHTVTGAAIGAAAGAIGGALLTDD